MENLTSLLNSGNKTFESDSTFTNYMGVIVDQSSGFDSNDPGVKRRSSSRSIKRRKFDDELVQYSSRIDSNSTPTLSGSKSSRTRTQSLTTTVTADPGQPLSPATPVASRRSIGKQPNVGQIKTSSTSQRHGGRGRQKHGRHSFSTSTKDLGRWKPTDDLALALGVLQTNDLRMVERGVKFSCRFTFQEIQQRWQALLYDPIVSKIAVAAIRNLHPDMIASVQAKALFSKAEEDLLGTIKSTETPTLEMLQSLLDSNPQTFYPTRTSKSLYNHWQLLKQYQLLPDQSVQSLPRGDLVLNFSDAEELVNDTELGDPRDEALENELAIADRRAKKEIRTLESELSRWQVLVDIVTGISTPDFDNQTLAVLRGRLVRYLMRSREISVGRCTKDHSVDIDLALEGPAGKVSRRQGTIRLRNNGDFFLSSEGKRPFYVDGRPILPGNKYRLNNNSVVENDDFPLQSTSTATESCQTIHVGGKSRTSLIHVQNQKLRIMDERNDFVRLRREPSYCGSKTDVRLYSRSREHAQNAAKVVNKAALSSREKVFSSPNFVVSDCWKTSSGEIPVKLIQLFKENCPEAEDFDAAVKKRRLDSEDNEMLSHTREFHVLNEVQKERILTVVEDTIKNMANKDLKDYSQGFLEPPPRTSFSGPEHFGTEKFFCKKFLLPWVIVKVVEMVLCHIIQLTFLSEESYFHRKNEFLPIVVTYYLTIFIVMISLIVHTSCFSCGGIRNPCYFMGAVSSSILTLTTTLGILVMLSSMEYYKSFREILVLVFIAILLCSLFAELCLCYFEVKTIWSSLEQTDLYYAD